MRLRSIKWTNRWANTILGRDKIILLFLQYYEILCTILKSHEVQMFLCAKRPSSNISKMTGSPAAWNSQKTSRGFDIKSELLTLLTKALIGQNAEKSFCLFQAVEEPTILLIWKKALKVNMLLSIFDIELNLLNLLKWKSQAFWRQFALKCGRLSPV